MDFREHAVSGAAGTPAQGEDNRLAFLRYLPRRIADFERRILRYRFAGWDPNGMTVLAGDARRLADASANYKLGETREHLLALAQMVGGFASSMRGPDPKQAERMFALLAAVIRSLPRAAPDQPSAAVEKPPSAGEPAAAILLDAAPPFEATVVAADTIAAKSTGEEATQAPGESREPDRDAGMPESSRPILPADEPGDLGSNRSDEASASSADASFAQIADLPEPSSPPSDAPDFDAPDVDAQDVDAPDLDAPADIADAVAFVSPAEPAEPDVPSGPASPESWAEPDPLAAEPAADVPVAPEGGGSPGDETSALVASPAAGEPGAEAGAASDQPDMGVEEPVAGTTSSAPDPAAAMDLDDAEEPEAIGGVGMRRIFHLSDSNAFAVELGQRLEAEGYAIEPVDNVDELSELLTCLMPHMLLVDASHVTRLAIIGALRRDAQQQSQPPRHIQMVVMPEQDTMDVRRAAYRSGADLVLFPPFDVGAVADRLKAMHASAAAEPVRVLVVDDERADALFAQAVLNRAGMKARVEHDPMRVIEALTTERADLILMDLHMPFANGVEVTMLLRDDPQFARIPIVFLSGESDPDSRLEAINAGGDDFLFKPIRPRHLVAAVQDRVRRLHAVEKANASPAT